MIHFLAGAARSNEVQEAIKELDMILKKHNLYLEPKLRIIIGKGYDGGIREVLERNDG